MFFKDSRPDRAKRAGVRPSYSAASIPPAKPYELLTEDEIRTGGNRTFIFDVESYPNYFEVGFKDDVSGKVYYFEDSADSSINRDLLGFILFRFLLIGFNSKVYDLPMLAHALDGVPCWKLKEISNELILSEQPQFDGRLTQCNHIDLIDVAPITASLKIYAGRLHCPRMQDLPYPDTAILTELEARNVRDYNLNDLDNTQLLYHGLKEEIALREALGSEYQIDLRSKSDAQVAEAVIVSELAKLGVRARKPTIDVGSSFRFTIPPGLSFRTERLQNVLNEVLNTDFIVSDNGAVDTPENLANLDIRVDGFRYTIGIGGLHSNEKSISYFASSDVSIFDRDVASYYPVILILQNLFPSSLGESFVTVFKSIVDRRLRAKAEGRKVEAASLKIVINGIIGKLSNMWSKVYAPEANTQITVSGQMYLLMLIEMLVLEGFKVVSANTDGVVAIVPRRRKFEFDKLCAEWEAKTGFTTEETEYKSIHSRDVNNYIAVKPDGTTKVKGVYSELGSAPPGYLSKNPESLIVTDALQAFLAKGIDVEQTVNSSADIKRFLNVRNVKGGGQKDGVYLGKAVRWYYSNCVTGTINYVLSGNAVPKSENARPCMELSELLPSDLDRSYYINEAREALFDVGFLKRPGQENLF